MFRFLNLAIFATLTIFSGINAFSQDISSDNLSEKANINNSVIDADANKDNNNITSTVKKEVVSNDVNNTDAVNKSITLTMNNNNTKKNNNNNTTSIVGYEFIDYDALIGSENAAEDNKDNKDYRAFYFKVFDLGISSFGNKNVNTIENRKIGMDNIGYTLGFRINFGAKKRFFFSLETSGLYAINGTGLKLLFTNDDSIDISNEIGSVLFRGFIIASGRIGLNLFNESISLYIKPSVGVGFVRSIAEYSKLLKFGPMYGIGVGVDFNISKYFVLFAECNYNIIQYTIRDNREDYRMGSNTFYVYKWSTMAVYQMLTFSFGAGFRF